MVAVSRSPLVLTAAIVADAAEGRLRQGRRDQVIASFTTDTRRIAPGQLFIALRGERFDGATFATASLNAGACGVLVPTGTEVEAAEGAILIEAADTLLALQNLSRYVRRRSGAQVVAITGSAGKTATPFTATPEISTTTSGCHCRSSS